MLPAAARMRRRVDFSATLRQGRRTAGEGVVLHYLPPPTGFLDTAATPTARVGFVVDRSVGGAVLRNAVRRRLRHAIRRRLEEVPGGAQLVVRATSATPALTPVALDRELAGALQRALTTTRRSAVRS